MKDIIYREDAVARITAEQKEEQDIDCIYIYSKCKAIIKYLPSAERTGRWIDTGSGQECSECHEIQYGYDNFRYFCAFCGARMVEE